MTHYPDIQVPGFVMDVRHWRTVAAFRAHLAGHDPALAGWARAVIVHHTVKPVAADWRGPASMRGLAQYYRGLGWAAGPHVFVVAGAPDPAHDGIWQLTPLDRPGVHAQAANTFAWGIEHVGDFDRVSMPPDVAALGAGVAAALLDWRSLVAAAATVRPHRDFAAKTCPGRLVDMPAYIRAVAALQIPRVATTPSPQPPRYSAFSPILAPSPLERARFVAAVVARCAGSPYGAPAIETAATHLYDLAVRGGVDPLVAAAQLCHETGNLTSAWSLPPHHNPAGIGVTGEPGKGVSFPDLPTGITAQIGRLIAYATLPTARTDAQRHLVSLALPWRDLPLRCHGSAVTLRALGAVHNLQSGCGWAHPGDAYGERIAAIANRLLEAPP